MARSLAALNKVEGRDISIIAYNPGLTGGTSLAGKPSPIIRVLLPVLIRLLSRLVSIFKPVFFVGTAERSGEILAELALGRLTYQRAEFIIVPGSIVYSLNTEKEWVRDGIIPGSILILQISGQLMLETSSEKISTKPGDMLLIRKNQLAKITKIPTDGGDYKTILILLNGDVLRRYALERQIEIKQKFKGKPNVFIPQKEFLKGFFKSLIPHADNSQATITGKLGLSKSLPT